MLEATHTPPEEIKEVVIAGAFGTYLNLDSALAIGLLPRLPNAKYVQVGNAAGVGAKMALLSLKERQRAQQIVQRTGYIELTTPAGFQQPLCAVDAVSENSIVGATTCPLEAGRGCLGRGQRTSASPLRGHGQPRPTASFKEVA